MDNEKGTPSSARPLEKYISYIAFFARKIDPIFTKTCVIATALVSPIPIISTYGAFHINSKAGICVSTIFLAGAGVLYYYYNDTKLMLHLAGEATDLSDLVVALGRPSVKQKYDESLQILRQIQDRIATDMKSEIKQVKAKSDMPWAAHQQSTEPDDTSALNGIRSEIQSTLNGSLQELSSMKGISSELTQISQSLVIQSGKKGLRTLIVSKYPELKEHLSLHEKFVIQAGTQILYTTPSSMLTSAFLFPCGISLLITLTGAVILWSSDGQKGLGLGYLLKTLGGVVLVLNVGAMCIAKAIVWVVLRKVVTEAISYFDRALQKRIDDALDESVDEIIEDRPDTKEVETIV